MVGISQVWLTASYVYVLFTVIPDITKLLKKDLGQKKALIMSGGYSGPEINQYKMFR